MTAAAPNGTTAVAHDPLGQDLARWRLVLRKLRDLNRLTAPSEGNDHGVAKRLVGPAKALLNILRKHLNACDLPESRKCYAETGEPVAWLSWKKVCEDLGMDRATYYRHIAEAVRSWGAVRVVHQNRRVEIRFLRDFLTATEAALDAVGLLDDGDDSGEVRLPFGPTKLRLSESQNATLESQIRPATLENATQRSREESHKKEEIDISSLSPLPRARARHDAAPVSDETKAKKRERHRQLVLQFVLATRPRSEYQAFCDALFDSQANGGLTPKAQRLLDRYDADRKRRGWTNA